MTKKDPIPLPQVNDHKDCQSYLKALLEHNKKHNSSFSLQWLANKAEIPSKSYITKIINHDIALTPQVAIKYLRAFEVSHEEILRFQALLMSGETIPIQILDQPSACEKEFCKDFIGLLVLRDDFKANEKWLYEAFRHFISIDVIKIALNEMIDDQSLILENDKWVSKRSRFASIPKHENPFVEIAKIDAPTTGSLIANFTLSKEAIPKFSDEVSVYIHHKLHEYSKKYPESETGEIMITSFFTKTLTDFN